MTVGSFLTWITRFAISMFWIMDIFDMPFMKKFDSEYPLNTVFWIFAIIFMFGYSEMERIEFTDEEER